MIRAGRTVPQRCRVAPVVLFDSSSAPYSIGGLDLICPEMDWSNLVALSSASAEFSADTQGTLSIKCSFGGEEVYRVKGERYRVAPDRFLILNCGQRYTSRVEKGKDAESLCLFFHPRFAEEGLRALVEPDDHLLDLPSDDFRQPVRFVEQLYPADASIFPRLAHLRERLHGRSTTGLSAEWLNQEFHLVLGMMLGAHREVAGRIRRVDAVRPGTRLELYRRLERAREFIGDNYAKRIRLADIAEASFLSPHHLLRTFRQVYSETPHQYLTRCRIEQAARRLATSDAAVTDICLDLGFDSPTSFSLLFRRHTGMSPREYRAARGRR